MILFIAIIEQEFAGNQGSHGHCQDHSLPRREMNGGGTSTLAELSLASSSSFRDPDLCGTGQADEWGED